MDREDRGDFISPNLIKLRKPETFAGTSTAAMRFKRKRSDLLVTVLRLAMNCGRIAVWAVIKCD